jgi:hypothetical protein
MGMYTEIHFNSELNIPKDSMVADILKYMLGETEELPELLPDHPLFKTDRWQVMLRMDSYYFDADTHSTLRWDKSGSYYLCIRSNLKNYDSEIEHFIDWIMPYLDVYKQEGDFLGFYRYEEDEEPTIIRYAPTKDLKKEEE